MVEQALNEIQTLQQNQAVLIANAVGKMFK